MKDRSEISYTITFNKLKTKSYRTVSSMSLVRPFLDLLNSEGNVSNIKVWKIEKSIENVVFCDGFYTFRDEKDITQLFED